MVVTARVPRLEQPEDPLVRLWRFLCSLKLAVALLLLLAVATLLGTLVAQAPAEVIGDPEAYRDWLAQTQGQNGPFVQMLDTLSVFTVFRSPWYWCLATLLGFSLAGCTLNRVEGVLRAVFRPHPVVSAAFLDRCPHRAVLAAPYLSAEVLAATLGQALAQRRHRLVVRREPDAVYLYADRNHLARLGTLVAHAGVLLLAIGILGGNLAGFRKTDFVVAVGDVRSVGQGTGLSLRLEEFADDYYPDGSPRDYHSEVVLLEHGREVMSGVVRVNEPLTYKGVTFHQAFSGYAVRLEVKAADGSVLFAGAVPLAYQFEDHTAGSFAIPGRDTIVVVAWTAGQSDESGDLEVTAYRDSTRAALSTFPLTQGQPQVQEGMTFALQGVSQFSGLQVSSRPLLPAVWGGGLLLLLGGAAVLYLPHHRLWARCRPASSGAEAVIAGLSTQDPGFTAYYRTLAQELESRLHRQGDIRAAGKGADHLG